MLKMFYVVASGEVSLLDVIDGAFNRLKFLLNLDKEIRGEYISLNINYLIENSELDNISHFALRLLCMRSQEFRQFFVDAETKFFEYRIQGIDWSTAFDSLQTFKKELDVVIDDRRSEELISFHACAIEICECMGEEVILMHVFHETHLKNCCKYMIKVPFSYCAELIRNREVDLSDGFCLVHCGAWKALLGCIFRFRLSFLVKHIERFINIRSVEFDDRIYSIVQPLLALLKHEKTKEYLGRGHLLSSLVDQESELFPPCARNALIHLRGNHKLSHQARFQFTVFLKDIGMDVTEALIFWKDEYSRKNDVQSMNIEGDLWSQKRSHYTYNIRHIYGMEGACKQYSSFSCSKLQAENRTLEGGCPFKTMSKRDLMKFLRNTYFVCDSAEGAEIPPIEEIMSHISLSKPSDACMTCFNAHKKKILSKKEVKSSSSQEIAKSTEKRDSNEYFQNKTNGSCSETDFKLSNPIQYYLALKNCTKNFC